MMTAAANAKVNGNRQEIDLPTLIERFGNEDRCHDFLVKLRWPEGVRCLRCNSDKVSRVTAPVGREQVNRKTGEVTRPSRRQFDCDSCRYQFSVRVGTLFHDSHLPLWKWFLAVYLIGESRKGISANQLKRTLGVSYKTAWYLCHRIRFAMGLVDADDLEGVVEVDETYVGGSAKSGSKKAKGRKGGTAHKVMVMGAIERGGDVRLRVEHRQGTSAIFKGFIAEVAEDADKIYTDTHPNYRAMDDPRHEAVDHSAEEWVRGEVGTQGIESAWSLLKRSIIGSYHQLSEKHLQAYADEFAFRFNNRENPFLFRDTLLALVEGERLTYDALVNPA
jgi:transposase-like protein